MNDTEKAVKARLAEVIDARTQLRDAVQRSDAAGAIWWDGELRLRQAFLRQWQDYAETDTANASRARY